VERDALGLCRPGASGSILGTYKTIGVTDSDRIADVVPNSNLEHEKVNGFTGIFVCRSTHLLKSIAYGAAAEQGPKSIDYTMDIVRPYIRKVKTVPAYISQILEFGTEETLEQTRTYLNGHD